MNEESVEEARTETKKTFGIYLTSSTLSLSLLVSNFYHSASNPIASSRYFDASYKDENEHEG